MTLGLILISFAAMPGCTGLEPAVIGAGVGAANFGVAFVEKGKLYSTERTDGRTLLAATLATCEELDLVIKEKQYHNDRRKWLVLARDDRNDGLAIRIDERTDNMTRLVVDMGLFGDEPTARLIYSRISHHLEAGAPLPEGELDEKNTE